MSKKDEAMTVSPNGQQTDVSRSYDEWIADLVKIMKRYPLVHNKWRDSKFRNLHKEGYTIKETFRIWFLNHT